MGEEFDGQGSEEFWPKKTPSIVLLEGWCDLGQARNYSVDARDDHKS